ESEQEPAPARRGRRASVDVGYAAPRRLRLPTQGPGPRPRPIILDVEHLGRSGQAPAEAVDGPLCGSLLGSQPQPRRPGEGGRHRAEPPPLETDERDDEG